MAGIYIHIPFCKKACHYCNFHFSTNLSLKQEIINAILLELKLRKDELSESIETIYFGGGTPSLLSTEELQKIFSCIEQNYNLSNELEISLEANPDDLTTESLKQLSDSPINRLSIGVQSFFNEDLIYMNRSHDEKQAKSCIEDALTIGFENLSIDLIYGSPSSDMDKWSKNLETTFGYPITHLSCYALTVESNTALDHFIKKGQMPAPNEQAASQQFELLLKISKENNFEHYEVSNFAKDQKYSKHNTSYWRGTKYLGIGPAAHSFDGTIRRWNISNNAKYLKAMNAWKINDHFNPEGHLYDLEKLSSSDRYNEYVMTSLRTMWGLDLNHVKINFGEAYLNHLLENAKDKLSNELLTLNEGKYTIPVKNKFFSDGIASDLFWV